MNENYPQEFTRDDLLNRREFAESLTKVILNNPEGLVMALNNPWGEGKTAFVTMWKNHLEGMEEELTCIYFNAWENDFETNPLVALLGEIKSKLNISDENMNKLSQKVFKATKKIWPKLISSVIKKASGIEVPQLIESLQEGLLDAFEEDVNDFAKKKESLISFKEKLEEFVNNEIKNKPLVVFIDELDRCKPSYSVELLETVKHLFLVKGIVFILSIDKVQLGHAIQGVYGSSKIDTVEYLRRFIHLEFSLPKSNKEKFVDGLHKSYFPSFYDETERLIAKTALENLTVLFNIFDLTPRQIESIYRLIGNKSYAFTHVSQYAPMLFSYLTILKIKEPEYFGGLITKNYSVNNSVNNRKTTFLWDKNYEFITAQKVLNTENLNLFVKIENMLLLAYNAGLQFDNDDKRIKGIYSLNFDEIGILIPSLIDSSVPEERGKVLSNFHKHFDSNTDLLQNMLSILQLWTSY